MKRVLWTLLILLTLLIFNGCSYSQYLLKAEYINPNTTKIERIDVPVSQYVYDSHDVGDVYNITIQTVVFGMRIPITDSTSSSKLGLIDTIPLAPMFALIFVLAGKRKALETIISITVIFGLTIFLISTQAPEFSTVGTIVDKTFQIVSG